MTVESATFGGGCFWCLEAPLSKLKGVNSVISGYADGSTTDPDYEQICSGTSGHAEVIQITYDADIIDYKTLLEVFFALHDPTTLNRQGADVGTQYRSTILYHNDKQHSEAKQFIERLDASDKYADPIVTELKPLAVFYKAEQYHQNYFQLNPTNRYCQAIILPKLEKLEHSYQSILK